MRDLGTLPGTQSSYAVAVNERGQVLGASCDIVGDNCRAFLWQKGAMTDLGALGHSGVFWPLAINDRGQVIGTVDTKAKYVIPGFWSLSGIPQAFLWQNGRVTKLGALGGPGSWAVAINERGQVVGSADTTAKSKSGWTTGMPIRHSFLWENGKMTDLGTLGGEASGAVAVSARGQVIGWSDTKAEVPHVFLWQNGKMRDLGAGYGGGDYGGQPGINERGQIVGSSCRMATKCRAFLWQNGRLTDLGALDDAFPESTAVAINGHNQILGQVWSPTSHAQHAVLWTLRSG
jgi:probable HAF family extracellular repeat protein